MALLPGQEEQGLGWDKRIGPSKPDPPSILTIIMSDNIGQGGILHNTVLLHRHLNNK